MSYFLWKMDSSFLYCSRERVKTIILFLYISAKFCSISAMSSKHYNTNSIRTIITTIHLLCWRWIGNVKLERLNRWHHRKLQIDNGFSILNQEFFLPKEIISRDFLNTPKKEPVFVIRSFQMSWGIEYRHTYSLRRRRCCWWLGSRSCWPRCRW